MVLLFFVEQVSLKKSLGFKWDVNLCTYNVYNFYICKSAIKFLRSPVVVPFSPLPVNCFLVIIQFQL